MAQRKASSTARGLGWRHQQHAASLHLKHTDGKPCWWCNLPMFKEPQRNWDARTLAADHTQARAVGGKRADRLLHSTCNSQRQDGKRDSQRPAVLGVHPREWLAALKLARAADVLGELVMPWV